MMAVDTDRTTLEERARRRLRYKVATLGAVLGGLLLVACGSALDSGEPAVVVPGGDPQLGKAKIEAYSCIVCHAVPGLDSPGTHVGPPLTAWAEREYIAGILPNEPNELILWIMNPQSVEPGTAMPNLGVSEADARDIASYLYTLEEE